MSVTNCPGGARWRRGGSPSIGQQLYRLRLRRLVQLLGPGVCVVQAPGSYGLGFRLYSVPALFVSCLSELCVDGPLSSILVPFLFFFLNHLPLFYLQRFFI